MNTLITTRQQQADQLRKGFTLVEMLISVTLVLLMMTMFTSIFQMATNSVSVQRGIAKNDQAARALTTTLKADLAKRSFTFGLPYYPTEVPATSPTPFGDRGGYIYISTNDPDSWQDDILQFTVNVNKSQEDTDDTLYFGRAELMYDLTADPAFGDTVRRTTLRHNPNQPDADDANLAPNQVSASSAAEVSYFIRNGNLYRRVMLLREPLPVAGNDLDIQPSDTISQSPYFGTIAHGGTNLGGWFTYVGSPASINYSDSSNPNHFQLSVGEITPTAWGVTASNDFYRHFDFSAVPVIAGGLPTTVAFNGIDALDNTQGLTALGNPSQRFGFNPLTGLSREHDNPTELQFIGRFLHAETSHTFFNWPLGASRVELDEVANNVHTDAGNSRNDLNVGTFLGDDGSGNPGNGNPMDLAGTQLHLDKTSGVLTELQGTTGRGGTRMVEDLLMANVHGMQVEIWDDRLQRFVTPGHSELRRIVDANGGAQVVVGDYHIARNLNPAYGPRGAVAPTANRVFDTWSSAIVTGGGAPVSPPFIPYRYYPPQQGDADPGPTPNTAPTPANEFDPETGVARNQGYWQGSDFSDLDPNNWTYQNYQVGDVVFAAVGYDGDTPNEIFEWDQDIIPAQAFQVAYRCVRAGYAGDYRPAAVQPPWPRVPDQTFAETGNALANNTAGPNVPAVWESIDNRRPLRSIRVTVNFFDQSTENLRQLSLVLPITTDH